MLNYKNDYFSGLLYFLLKFYLLVLCLILFSNFNPDSINVIGNDVKLRLDVSLDKGTIDYIDSDITGNVKITTL